jgi:hypothetical protein
MTAPDAVRLRVHAQRVIQFAQQGAKVAMWCIGSHGRTGTLLATCIGLLEPDVDPIDAVRERHCEHAVETHRQLESVFEALGRPVPEKWKQAPVVKTYPAYASQGKAFREGIDDTNIVNGYMNECGLCTKPGGLGKDKLHWRGKYLVHHDCWEQAVKRVEEEEARTKPNSKSISSAKEPTSDSPSGAAQGTIVDEEIGLGFSFSDVDETQFREEMLKERPFVKRKWTKSQRRRIKNVDNAQDCFGDYICYDCEYLISDPKDFQFKGVDKYTYAIHKDCISACQNPDNIVVCGNCWDRQAESDGFCTLECAQECIEKNAATDLNGTGATPQSENNDDTSKVNFV